MQRRKFLRAAASGGAVVAAAGTLAAPAVAQSMPEVKWRMASSFPKSLDAIYGAGEYFAKRVAILTDNDEIVAVIYRSYTACVGSTR